MVQFQRLAVACGVILIVSFCAATASSQLLDDVGPRSTPDPQPVPSWIDQVLNPTFIRRRRR